MLTEEQYDQSAVNYSNFLLLEAEEEGKTLETLKHEREQANAVRTPGLRSYAVEGYDKAIDILQQQQQA